MNAVDAPKITLRTWLILTALAVTGQIAWAVENSWFNTFVYDTITPDPRPVAWMTAASAITATLTTLLMGTLSDRTRSRWGRRRPYILLGYILWGISTILFPTVAYIKVSSLAVMMVVVMDSIGDASKIVSGTTEITKSPDRLLIAATNGLFCLDGESILSLVAGDTGISSDSCLRDLCLELQSVAPKDKRRLQDEKIFQGEESRLPASEKGI